MSARTRLAHRTAPLVLAAASAGLLVGCGPQTAAPGSDGDSTPVASEAPAPTRSEPTDTGSPDVGSTEPSDTTPPSDATTSAEPGTGSLADALLPAAEVPGFNDQFTWVEGPTENREPRELAGTCHRFEMTSIGAEEVAHRAYTPQAAGQGAGRATAGELVAQFPDEATAARAFEVLESWRKDCRANLQRFERVRVGDLVDVATEAGEAGWYLLVYGPAEGDPDSAWFDAEGMVMVGNRIAVLRLALVGQDYNYETGQEPMVAAVRAAAARL